MPSRYIQKSIANGIRWLSWIRWLSPIYYMFEAVLTNEFEGRHFECSQFVPTGPGYQNIAANQRACATPGSRPGEDFVSGTVYAKTAYGFSYSHRWRNYFILLAFTVALLIAHLVMSEIVASERSKGEVLVFRRSKMKSTKRATSDEESGSPSIHNAEKYDDGKTIQHDVQKQDSVFHWEKVNYEIQIKNETRKILDSVDGWIKPGTLTALMVRSYRFFQQLDTDTI